MAETSEVFRVGLLGHGTVGGAFAALLEERAGAVAATTGLRPELTGVLTRSKGDFEEILAGSDLIVELIGGIEPARDYVLRAMRAGKHVVSANKQLLSQHGEESSRPTSSCSPSTARSCGRSRARTASSCASRARSRAWCR
jgi:homoserine dehydrogenase